VSAATRLEPVADVDPELAELIRRADALGEQARAKADETAQVVRELTSLAVAQIHDQRLAPTRDARLAVQAALADQEQLLGRLDVELRRLREAQEAERQVRDVVDETTRVAEDELAELFVVRSNKSWLTTDANGTRIAEGDQRAYTADEKRAWIAAEARKRADVAGAITAHRQAELDVQLARDAKESVLAQLSGVKHALDARVAILNAITAGAYAPAWKEA